MVYLSKKNCPEIEGTPEGGVRFSFSQYGMGFFDIDFLPEGFYHNYRYRDWNISEDTEGKTFDYENCKGTSNNLYEVFQNLLEKLEDK
jgi:hypothetical protein